MIRRQFLEHWRQVSDAAPAGPWRGDGDALVGAAGERLGEIASKEGLEFVLAAREGMPALLAELDHVVTVLRDIGRSQERHCPDCGPVDALGHRKRCRIAPYLR